MSEFSSEISDMSSVTEAACLIRQVAEPRPVGDKVKVAIRRAAQRLGFAYSRSKDIWYEDARRIDANEMDRLRFEAARRERDVAIESMVALRRQLAAGNSPFHREMVVALDTALGGMGAAVGPADI